MNSIRQVFGNHNSYRLFMNLINNVDTSELLEPVMYREVNGLDAELINSKTKHNKLMRDLSRELNVKYIRNN
jgi:hypothetical protein